MYTYMYLYCTFTPLETCGYQWYCTMGGCNPSSDIWYACTMCDLHVHLHCRVWDQWRWCFCTSPLFRSLHNKFMHLNLSSVIKPIESTFIASSRCLVVTLCKYSHMSNYAIIHSYMYYTLSWRSYIWPLVVTIHIQNECFRQALIKLWSQFDQKTH